jgi:hypothetical protein
MNITSEFLASIEPRQITTWLRAKGWVVAEDPSGKFATWRKEVEAGDYLVDIPLQTTFRDYSRRLFEVLETLVIAEHMPAHQILGEVQESTFDVLRLHAHGPAVGQGRIPLEIGPRLFESTRNMLLAAACSAHEPRVIFRTRKPTPAVEFLRRVKLAAPEAGSFIITAFAPVPPQLQISLVEDPPYDRQVTLMLASGVSAALQAAQAVVLGADAEPFLRAVSRGVSVNLCESLADFVDGEQITSLDLQFGWAASRHVPSDTPHRVQIGSDLSPILREAGQVLRATSVSPDFELIGAVVKLESSDPGSGGNILVVAEIDGRPRKVAVMLPAEDYARATDAHRDGQIIRCEGELKEDRGRLTLLRSRNLVVLTDG